MYTDIFVKVDFLREYLNENEMSESQFAEIIGVSHSTVNRIFNGKRNPGSKFIAGVLKNFEFLTFEQVFFFNDKLPKGNKSETF